MISRSDIIRYAPYGVIWLFAIPFFLWFAFAPRTADPRFWQVDAVEIRLGSSQVHNPADDSQAPTLDQAALKSAEPAPVERTADPELAPPPILPSDGVQIAAVDARFQEESSHGPVPKIADDGTAPWQYYARPFDAADTRPRLAIVIQDMGLSEAATMDAIKTLPGQVTLAFSSYGDGIEKHMQAARDAGHETLVQLPLEVPAGATVDVGPDMISAAHTAAVNQDNLIKLLAKANGSIGFITMGGGRLVNNEKLLKPLMKNIRDRGLVFIDNTRQAETLSPLFAEEFASPWARTAIRLDVALSRASMEEALAGAIGAAHDNGNVIVVAGSSPLARSVLANGVNQIERAGVALVPVSAIITQGSATDAPVVEMPSPPGLEETKDRLAEPSAEMPEDGPINLLNPDASDQPSGDLLGQP